MNKAPNLIVGTYIDLSFFIKEIDSTERTFHLPSRFFTSDAFLPTSSLALTISDFVTPQLLARCGISAHEISLLSDDFAMTDRV